MNQLIVCLADNLREHNAKMREQCEDLALWKRREQEKFEQTKALITALRADNQDMQVQIMTFKDKEVGNHAP